MIKIKKTYTLNKYSEQSLNYKFYFTPLILCASLFFQLTYSKVSFADQMPFDGSITTTVQMYPPDKDLSDIYCLDREPILTQKVKWRRTLGSGALSCTIHLIGILKGDEESPFRVEINMKQDVLGNTTNSSQEYFRMIYYIVTIPYIPLMIYQDRNIHEERESVELTFSEICNTIKSQWSKNICTSHSE